MDILVIFIVMPLTDLPVTGQLIATLFGLLNTFVIIPILFFDVFSLFYMKQFGCAHVAL